MTISRFKQFSAALALSGILSLSITPLANAAALAQPGWSSNSNSSSSSPCKESTPPTTLSGLKGCGNSLITGRLTAIQKMSTKLGMMVEVSAKDKAALNQSLTSDKNGLTALKTKLANDTSVTTAKPDYLSIFSAYRIYMLVVPRINVVKVADNQLVSETTMETVINKFLAPIINNPNNGLSTADQAKAKSLLADAQKQMGLSKATSAKVETTALALTAKDYNSDHTVLQDDYKALVTAQGQLVNAYDDLNAISNLSVSSASHS